MIRDSTQAHRLPKVRPLILVVALGVALAGCGGGGDESTTDTSTPSTGSPVTSRPEARPGTKTFRNDKFGITFDYPDDFKPGTVTGTAEAAGGKPVAETAVALDEDNALFIAKYVLAAAVTEQNVDDALPEVDSLVRQLSGQPARGRLVEVGGLPAIRYDDVSLKEPANGKSRLAFVFIQNNEYLVNCQSTPPKRSEVDRACDLALGTLAKT